MYEVNNNNTKSFIGIGSYIARCDYIFNQTFKEIPYPNNRLRDITSNSTVFCWGDYLNYLFDYLSKTNLTNITLISGCSDHPTNPNGTLIGLPLSPKAAIIPAPKNIVKWYAQNTEIVSDFMKPSPIGVDLFPLNIETIKKYKINCSRDKLLYLNFNNSTNPVQRNYVRNIIRKECPSVTVDVYGDTETFLVQLQRHKFCICPPGNGKDTHRAWNAIALGCIPIVEKSNMNDFYATLFPFLVIDRWSDINEEFLNIKYNEIKNKSWRYDLLDTDNWFNYFNIKISTTHKKFEEIISTISSSTSDIEKCILEY